jgi:hypothetical protein
MLVFVRLDAANVVNAYKIGELYFPLCLFLYTEVLKLKANTYSFISNSYRSVMMYRASIMKRSEQQLLVSNDVQVVYNETF